MKKLITLIIALAMAFVMALPAFAADNKTIYLPEKMSWMTAGTEARNYCDFPTVRCHSVYPESGLDLFSTIRCRLKRDSVVISDIVHLSERSPDYTTITLKEGYEHSRRSNDGVIKSMCKIVAVFALNPYAESSCLSVAEV